MRFWDSSALVALAIPESQSAACSGVYETDSDITVWAMTPVEVLAALHRRSREGVLDREVLDGAFRRLGRMRTSWTEVLDVELVRTRAERIVAVHPVRAADALQLAAALVACAERPNAVPFVTLDDRLAEAAGREGFRILPG